jgi:hypothetical protein
MPLYPHRHGNEAEAYMAEMVDFELDEEALKKAAGGVKFCEDVDNCFAKGF